MNFRQKLNPFSFFGANLGAMIDGFSKYLSMVVGNQSLMFLIIGAYRVSLGLQIRLVRKHTI